TFFEDVLGKCERILKTPLPLSYTRHTSRFIFLWLTILPFTMVAELGELVIPVELFTAMFLLGIEDIGVLIEEPFSVLACEAICGSVVANTTALLQQQTRDRELVSNVMQGQPKTYARTPVPAAVIEPVAAAAPVAEPKPVVQAVVAPMAEPEPVVQAAAAPVAEPEPVVAAAPVAKPEPVVKAAAAPVAKPEPVVKAAAASVDEATILALEAKDPATLTDDELLMVIKARSKPQELNDLFSL
ncbi:hypothetical protein CYMTET_36153, partial [Cymbomonas tetramitiformis]